jgi:hypothetical protein
MQPAHDGEQDDHLIGELAGRGRADFQGPEGVDRLDQPIESGSGWTWARAETVRTRRKG